MQLSTTVFLPQLENSTSRISQELTASVTAFTELSSEIKGRDLNQHVSQLVRTSQDFAVRIVKLETAEEQREGRIAAAIAEMRSLAGSMQDVMQAGDLEAQIGVAAVKVRTLETAEWLSRIAGGLVQEQVAKELADARKELEDLTARKNARGHASGGH